MSRGWLLVAVVLGCGADPVARQAQAGRDARYADAERAFSAERPDADALLRGIEADASATPEARAVATYRRGQLAERAGRVDEARRLYGSLAGAPPERAALAAWRLARLDGSLRAFIDAWPNAAAADRAVEDLAHDDPDPADTIRWLEAAATRHAGTTVADNCLWWAADAALRRLGELGTARRLLRRLVAEHGRSPLLDDALWRLAAIYRSLGDGDRAVGAYEALVAARDEESWFVGSYKSERLDDARWMIGAVRLAQGRADEARRAFEALLRAHPTSRLRDDAAWGAVCVAPRGEVEAALLTFRERYPESRFAVRGLRPPAGCPAGVLAPGIEIP